MFIGATEGQGVLKMITGILGKKLAMSQRFDKKGKVLPVTEISAGPVTVVQVKTKETDGYLAIQLAYGAKKRTTKPILGHLKKAVIEKPPLVLREFKFSEGDLSKPGDKFTVDQILKPGDLVSVTGISKGKGFEGVVKRWGFGGGPASHGQKDRLRAPGSIGQTTTIGRVFRGKKMAGRTGQERVTIENLRVVEVEGAKNLLVLSGSVSGGPNSILKIEKIGVAKKPFEVFVKEEKGGPPSHQVSEGKEEENDQKG